MRLRRLDLLRYGRFSGTSLDLPPHEPDFHIVLGPNEAGKSTALSAIEDLLFGIPPSSPLNFRHDYASMRIGAVLQKGEETLDFRRRKGNKDTLLTSEDLPLPAGDAALAPFLAGADREFLARMFSLDHVRLRQGGREILDARDDVGQALFSAGVGLSGLREKLTALQEEADGLWATRRAARRKYFQAEERLKEADHTLRAHTVTAARWQDSKRAHDALQEAYTTLEGAIEQKAAEQRRLARVRRVYRNVHRKSELDEALADLRDAVMLPEGALQSLQASEADDANAATRVETLKGQLEAARTERSGLAYDEPVVAHETDIQLLHERRIKVRDGKADLPKRHAELAGAEADLRRLAGELEWGADDLEQLITRIPPRAKVNTIRTLLSRRGERMAALDSASTAVEDAAARVAELRQQHEALGQTADTLPLAAATRATRDLGDVAAQIRSAQAEAVSAQADTGRWLGILRPAVSDEAVLGVLAVPPRDTVQAHRDTRRALDQRLQGCRERIRAAQIELERQRRAREQLVRDEHAVAPDELSQARQRRDAGWSLIRRRYVDGVPVPDEEMHGFGIAEAELADAYEQTVRGADDLADRRFDKAEAVAQLTVISRQIADQELLIEELSREAEEFGKEGRSLDADWGSIWAGCRFEPLAPDAMLEWLANRKEALVAAERKASADRQLAALRRHEVESKATLVRELVALGIATLTDQPLAVVLEAAADVLRRHERNTLTRNQLDDAQRQADADAARKRSALEKAEAAWSEWQSRWADGLAALGLDSAAGPESVAAQVDAIDEMRESAAKVNDLRHERIGKIERDVAAFARDVGQMAAMLAPDLAEIEPEEAVLQLERRLAEAKRLHDILIEKDDAIAALEQSVSACEKSRRDALQAIAGLQNAAGASGIDELRDAIAKSDRRRNLEFELARLLPTIEEQGDGFSAGELEAECRAVDLDQATAREASLAQELEELRRRLLEAREQRSLARQAFEAIGGDDTAARAAAVRQEALAEMQQVAERYTRVRAAALLLQWAIDRYRREKQGPLLKRASQLFAKLTGGSFNGLRVEFDEQDKAQLTGVRPDGKVVQVPGMSTGTADQLYLALRIASISDYLDRAPALPFVADDLFINFDDRRAAAGLQVLGDLAKETQVLFFTHHQHLVDIARMTLGITVPVISLHDEATVELAG